MKSKLTRRIALTALAVAVPAMAVGTLSAGASTATKIKFTGTISCTVKGSLTAVPPITTSSASHTFTLAATLSGCSGSTSQGGVTITGASLKATASATASCTSLTGIAPAGNIYWKANLPGAAATKISFSNAGDSISSTGIITVTLPGSGGTSTASGSFAGTTSTATAVLDQTESSLISACFGTGVSKLTFTGKHGTSKITVG